jgi:hypothetical protein
MHRPEATATRTSMRLSRIGTMAIIARLGSPESSTIWPD